MPMGGETSSNTVYTASIVETILKIIEGVIPPGTYDLITHPQWTWRQVYEYEAKQCDLPIKIETLSDGAPKVGIFQNISAGLANLAKVILRSEFLPDFRWYARRLLSYMPLTLNMKAEAIYLQKRAQTEIGSLLRREISDVAFAWVPNGKHFITCLTGPSELLKKQSSRLHDWDAALAFPPDLPYYNG
jgi:hypothetical protein